jgi:glycosyltransferase involved in cell wall biosynthesis
VLSYILPAYNCAAVVAETVDSILAQDAGMPFEILAQEDGSTDETWAVLEELRARHGDVLKVDRNESNRGEGATRNAAIARTSGDLLYIIDADNVLPEGLVRRLVEHREATGLHAVSVEELRFFTDDTANVTGTSHVEHHDGVSGLDELLTTWRAPASHGNYLITKQLFDAVGGYPEGLTMSAWAFGLKHVARGYPVAVLPGTFYFHRVGHVGNWVRGERLGINDAYGLEAMRGEAERLPPDVAAKVAQLRDGDPFFPYLEQGVFRPGGEVPGAARRWANRRIRRLRALRG